MPAALDHPNQLKARINYIAHRRAQSIKLKDIAAELKISTRTLRRYMHKDQYWIITDELLQQQLEDLPNMTPKERWNARMNLLRLMWPKENNQTPPQQVDINVTNNNNTTTANINIVECDKRELAEYAELKELIRTTLATQMEPIRTDSPTE